MKKRSLLLLITIIYNAAYSQDCKPESQTFDKFTKQQITRWAYWIEKPSFGQQVWDTDFAYLNLEVQQEGSNNYLLMRVTKREEVAASAAYQSPMKGEKGNKFLLAFKDAETLTFTANTAYNKTEYNKAAKAWEATVVLATDTLSSEQLEKMKEILTKHPIDAVRIELENNNTINQNIKEKAASEMMAVFNCFYKAISK